jgi:hypothetical protein
VEHASRSGSLLRLKVSHARVSQSDLKTGRGCVERKLKTDGSMRWAASDLFFLKSSFLVY